MSNAGDTQANDDDLPTEYQVKAAFLYNFLKFVDWPDSAFINSDAPYVIGVLGQDPFENYLDQITKDKKVKGRPIVIKRFKRYQQLKECHILFFSYSEESRYRRVLADIGNKSVLTVGDTDVFIKDGGMIRFFMTDNKVRFEINLTATKNSNLKLSSKLLQLAKIVDDVRGGD
jgi:hypothetical protein